MYPSGDVSVRSVGALRSVSILLLSVLLLIGVFAPHAYATPVRLGFTCVSNNNAVSAAIAEAQVFVDVYTSANQAHFKFWNIGANTCSLTDVYFDDGTLLGIASIIDADEGGGHAGVDFERGAKPTELPNGPPDFETTAGFSADSDPPVPTWGVEASNPANEWLEIIFDINPKSTPDAVFGELETGELRIGIHVQSIGPYSESLVNIIPEPATIAILALGSIALLSTKRRRS